LKRGDVVVTVVQGDHGKPRPAIIVQTDVLNGTHPTILLCLISSKVTGNGFRMPLPANQATGLRLPSEAMIDKLHAVKREKVTQKIGALSPEQLSVLDRKLVAVLGLTTPHA
jgi:mRNA interferase MazF